MKWCWPKQTFITYLIYKSGRPSQWQSAFETVDPASSRNVSSCPTFSLFHREIHFFKSLFGFSKQIPPIFFPFGLIRQRNYRCLPLQHWSPIMELCFQFVDFFLFFLSFYGCLHDFHSFFKRLQNYDRRTWSVAKFFNIIAIPKINKLVGNMAKTLAQSNDFLQSTTAVQADVWTLRLTLKIPIQNTFQIRSNTLWKIIHTCIFLRRKEKVEGEWMHLKNWCVGIVKDIPLSFWK